MQKDLSTSLGSCATPPELPTSDELRVIYTESEFATWCMIHGYTPSCIAMSVYKMRYPVNNVQVSFTSTSVHEVLEFLQKESLLLPNYEDVFKVELILFT